MIGKAIFSKLESPERDFRWRGSNVSRVEALSDAVFAFALTLLVVSLEVPKSFDELSVTIRQFPTFAVCFSLLTMCWHAHYIFHRRYGLEDFTTTLINFFLLFVMLFYVYPLKFIFSFLIYPLVGLAELRPQIRYDQMRWLMMFYGAGFTGIFTLFLLQYRHAWRLADALELDARERVLTRSTIRAHAIMVGVGLISIAIASIGTPMMLAASGFLYFVIGPLQWWNGARSGREVERLRNDHQATG